MTSISAILSTPSCNGLETIGLMKGLSSRFDRDIAIAVSVSRGWRPRLFSHRLRGSGEFSASNFIVLLGSRSMILKVIDPMGLASIEKAVLVVTCNFQLFVSGSIQGSFEPFEVGEVGKQFEESARRSGLFVPFYFRNLSYRRRVVIGTLPSFQGILRHPCDVSRFFRV